MGHKVPWNMVERIEGAKDVIVEKYGEDTYQKALDGELDPGFIRHLAAYPDQPYRAR